MPMLTDDEILDALATAGIPRERPFARDVGPYDVTEPMPDIRRLVAEIEGRTKARLQASISIRLNDYLVEMKPDMDDSIVGFNEALDIVRKVFEPVPAPVAP